MINDKAKWVYKQIFFVDCGHVTNLIVECAKAPLLGGPHSTDTTHYVLYTLFISVCSRTFLFLLKFLLFIFVFWLENRVVKKKRWNLLKSISCRKSMKVYYNLHCWHYNNNIKKINCNKFITSTTLTLNTIFKQNNSDACVFLCVPSPSTAVCVCVCLVHM